VFSFVVLRFLLLVLVVAVSVAMPSQSYKISQVSSHVHIEYKIFVVVKCQACRVHNPVAMVL